MGDSEGERSWGERTPPPLIKVVRGWKSSWPITSREKGGGCAVEVTDIRGEGYIYIYIYACDDDTSVQLRSVEV